MADSPPPIHVLHVDDDPEFADVTATFLTREEDRLTVQTASNADEALAALADHEIDCIVSDYDMPGQNGIEFLETVRDTHPDLPFILYTGKGSEAVASDAIAAGVTDYIQKQPGTDQYTILANRITNAVEQRRAEHDLRHTTAQLEALFENSPDMINIHDGEGNLLRPNPQLRAETGYDEATLTDMKVWELDQALDPEDATTIWASMDPGDTHRIEGRYRRRDGSTFPVEVHIRCITIDGKERYVAISRDISDRYERERALEAMRDRMEFALQATDSELYEIDLTTGEETRHGPFEQLYGIDPATVPTSEDFYERVVHPDDRATLRHVQQEQAPAHPGETFTCEYRTHPEIDEDRYIVTRVSARTDQSGNPTTIIGLSTDITERKRRERTVTALHDATTRLLRADTRQDAADTVVDIAETVLAAPYSTVFLYDADSEHLYAEATSEDADDVFGPPPEFQPGEGLVGEVFQSGEVVVLDDAQEDPRGLADGSDAIRGYCLVPIDDYGVLMFGASEVGVFDQRDVDIAELLAAHVTVAFERIDREETLREREQALERQNDRLTEAKTRYESLFENNPVPIWEEDLSAAKAYVDSLAEAVDDVEAHLLANPEELDAIFEQIDVIDVNETAVEYYEASSKQELIDNIDQLTTEEAVEVNAALWAQIAAGATQYRTETVSQTLAGDRRHELFEFRVPEAYADGYSRAYITANDITERKELEASLRAEKARFEQLLETSPVGITLLNADGEIVQANQRAEDVLGLSESEIRGRTYDAPEWQIVDANGDVIPSEELPFARVLRTGEPVYDYEHGIVWPDGTDRWLTISAAPLRTEAGEVEQVIAVIKDITAEREYEQTLEAQNERLESFASIVSHDLRNPLNVAEGRLALAQEECDSEHLAHIERAHERMEALIDDLLTLAREGEPVSDTEQVELASLVEACWASVATEEATLVVETEQVVWADASRLRQVFENLMRNAVEHGGNAVTVTVGDLADGFYVADDGPGIPPDDREDVFESGYSTTEEGTGFGLSIVKQVVEAHDWAISVTESDAGGARFEITGVEVTGE